MSLRLLPSLLSLSFVAWALGCSSSDSEPTGAGGAGSGGISAVGGGASGGGPLGDGGTGSGGAPTSGGSSAGGAPSVGGSAGSGSGGGGADPAGGASAGGSAGSGGAQGAGGEGSGGAPATPAFFLGADISSVQESNSTFIDTDGQQKSIFALLRNHGFNSVRLRTFVDPMAPYGYASSANGCTGKSEAYGDKAHVIAYGKQAKDHGMGLLVDFHYSDVWADPGNQIIPQAWRNAANIDALAELVKEYTKDFIEDAIAEGARPDMVQIGNEITPGMLMHVPGANTDCWGNQPASAPFGGSTSNWTNLGKLLSAGASAVREVDPTILIMLHVENTDELEGVRWWLNQAIAQGVDFDVFGLSCYTKFQGQPSVWQNTFTTLANEHPNLKFVIAEYNPERTRANEIMRDLPGGRGIGTFFWEPTQSGEWGEAMFTWQGNTARAKESDFAEFDALRESLGL